MGGIFDNAAPAAGAGGLVYTANAAPVPHYTFAQGGVLQTKPFTLTDASLTGVKFALVQIDLSPSGNTAGPSSINGTNLSITDAAFSPSDGTVLNGVTVTDSGGFSFFTTPGGVYLLPVTAGTIPMSLHDGAGGPHNSSVTISILGTFS